MPNRQPTNPHQPVALDGSFAVKSTVESAEKSNTDTLRISAGQHKTICICATNIQK